MAASWQQKKWSAYFFLNSLERWDISVFSVYESIGIVRFHVRPKTRLRWPFRFINFNKSFLFSVNALKPGIYMYMFSGSSSLLALSVFMCDPNRSYSGHFDFIIVLRLFCITYWKQLCQISRHFVSLHQPRGI